MNSTPATASIHEWKSGNIGTVLEGRKMQGW